MLLQLSHFLLPFITLHPALLSHQHLPPPQLMSMVCTYKFFGFSISYTILKLSLSILYLPIMLLIPYTHSSPSLLITLHVISTSVILFLSLAYFNMVPFPLPLLEA